MDIRKHLKEAAIPNLYSQDGKGMQALAVAHLFLGGCDWYITEYDGDDTIFGFACLNADIQMAELGYASVSELAAVKTRPLGQGVEFDLYWKPKTLAECKAELERRYGARR